MTPVVPTSSGTENPPTPLGGFTERFAPKSSSFGGSVSKSLGLLCLRGSLPRRTVGPNLTRTLNNLLYVQQKVRFLGPSDP